jgi:hypothetical protein
MKNALDHYGHIGSRLVYWFGHLVHDGRIHSRSPGHRNRGGADEYHSRSEGRIATMERISAAGPREERGDQAEIKKLACGYSMGFPGSVLWDSTFPM